MTEISDLWRSLRAWLRTKRWPWQATFKYMNADWYVHLWVVPVHGTRWGVAIVRKGSGIEAAKRQT